MISNTVKSGTMKISLGHKCIKLLHDVIVPVLFALAVICTVLSCFENAPGKHSREICMILAVLSYALVFTVKHYHKKLVNTNPDYKMFQWRIVRKLDLAHLVPLLILTVIIAFPFYLLFVTSIKNPFEANSFDFSWWPKEGVYTKSYSDLFSFEDATGVTMFQTIINSFVYAIIPNVIGLFASAVSAYAFSKFHFRGRNALYHALIMTMMMPGCVTMATGYMMYDWYGWTNTALPLIVPGMFGGAATVMFLREFFMGIPDGLLEAAKIDGAGRWRSFAFIMLPLGRPALMAQFILGFITAFNSYMAPLIYLNDPSGYTIQIAIDFLNGAVVDNSLVAAAGIFALAPMLLLYIIFQKPILNGISISSGLKG